jgi:hypothetical protein
MSQFKILSLEHVVFLQEEQSSGSVEPPAKEIITLEYGTWQADNWVPILQAENSFNEDTVG